MKTFNTETKTFCLRMTASHTVAYFLAGIWAVNFMDYETVFNEGMQCGLRPFESPWIAAGAGLQVIRGALLGLILLPFRSIFTETSRGWLKFWLLSFGLIYAFTFGAETGSFEGFIYTSHSLKEHFLGLPEMLIYNSLFAALMWYWYKKPSKILNIVLAVFTALIVVMSLMGALMKAGVIAPVS